jgi:hypothetical protein
MMYLGWIDQKHNCTQKSPKTIKRNLHCYKIIFQSVGKINVKHGFDKKIMRINCFTFLGVLQSSILECQICLVDLQEGIPWYIGV